MNRWIVLCRDVSEVKYDIWTIGVQISKNSKDYGILPKFDWKYQVVCLKLDNWVIDFSLDSEPEWYPKFDKLKV